MRIKSALSLFLLLGLFSCSDEEPTGDLHGMWADTGSFGMEFIEFYSKNEGRFGLYAKNFERYENFTYRLFDNKIAIDFVDDDEGETIHNLTFVNKNKIAISELTVIPENPAKIYQRFNIKNKNVDNTIALGVNDFYFDFESGIRLQAYLSNESRCPTGATCIWQGYAAARIYLIVDGNFEHSFELATIDVSPEIKRDTVLNNIKYRLLDITPYPDLSKEYKIEDYKVLLSVEN
jgi:hypothetical protein